MTSFFEISLLLILRSHRGFGECPLSLILLYGETVSLRSTLRLKRVSLILVYWLEIFLVQTLRGVTYDCRKDDTTRNINFKFYTKTESLHNMYIFIFKKFKYLLTSSVLLKFWGLAFKIWWIMQVINRSKLNPKPKTF